MILQPPDPLEDTRTTGEVIDDLKDQNDSLRAQVAMLVNVCSRLSHKLESLPETYAIESEWLELSSALENTQATAEQVIAECEQRGAVKALEEAINYIMSGRINSANGFQITEKLRCRLEELRATSKKAG